MKKLNIKAIVVVALVIFTVFSVCAPVFAAQVGGTDINPTTSNVDDSVKTAGNNILGYVQVIGSFIAVGVLMFLGIKYMTSSPSEKGDIKKSMIPYIIGAVILLTAVNIVPIIAKLGSIFGVGTK